MRKSNKGLLVAAMAAAFMMIATACGSSNKETTAAESSTAETVETTTADETEEGVEANADASNEETDEESTVEETTAETPAETKAGVIETDNSFNAANGKYTISVPSGWVVDSDSDEELATFTSANGNDMIEVIYVTGDAVDSERQILPATADEFKQYIARGDESLDIVKYDVKNDGATFRYAVKYNSADESIKYTEVAGYYDAGKKEYLSATATVESDGQDAIDAVSKALDSFKKLN